MTKLTVVSLNPENVAALRGGLDSTACIELDQEDGILRALPQASKSEEESIILRWSIPPFTATAANLLLEEIEPIAQALIDGEITREKAREEIAVLVEEATHEALLFATEMEVVRAREGKEYVLFYGTVKKFASQWGITPHTSVEDLQAKARIIQEEELRFPREPTVVVGLDEALRWVRCCLAEGSNPTKPEPALAADGEPPF